MSLIHRRNFLKSSGMLALPLLTGSAPVAAFAQAAATAAFKDADAVYFINDGIFYKPADFLAKLQEVHAADPIERDAYAQDGTMARLLQHCATITGKEAAVYMPSGTLANQLAIQVLSGGHTKTFVQETSHVYRDEADAAQTLFHQRLLPLAKGEPWFRLEALEEAVAYHKSGEAFEAGAGVVSIETPVRRCDNKVFPLDEIRRIAGYCRQQGYKMHLDGARLHVACAYTGASVKDYAQYFDTVYLCLYKYLGATGGAVLCGDKTLIGKMQHLVKIHGGGIFTNWPSAAMALHHLQDIDAVQQQVKEKAAALFPMLNRVNGFEVQSLEGGSNISLVQLAAGIDPQKLGQYLRKTYNIVFSQTPREDGLILLKVNPTLLRRDNKQIAEAFKDALAFARS